SSAHQRARRSIRALTRIIGMTEYARNGFATTRARASLPSLHRACELSIATHARCASRTRHSPRRSNARVKALVKANAGPGFVLRDVDEPSIKDNEVLIRVRRAGVCGTDVHIYDWDPWAQGRVKPPIVVGHEFAGEVARVGSLVTDVKVGDRVTAEGHIGDGRCLLCRTGNTHVCPNTR